MNGMEEIATYKGHSLRVNSLCFNYNDLYMLSTSLDGAVYELCLGDFTKEDYKVKESVIKVYNLIYLLFLSLFLISFIVIFLFYM